MKKSFFCFILVLCISLYGSGHAQTVYKSPQIEIKTLEVIPGEMICEQENCGFTSIYFTEDSLVRLLSSDAPDQVQVFQPNQVFTFKNSLWKIENIGNNKIRLILIVEKAEISYTIPN